jgi:acetyl esterase/lipase
MADPNSPDGPNGIYVLPFADTDHVRTVFRDVAYADRSPFQALDLYLPEGAPPAFGWPLVVFVHGGAWMMCDKRDIQLKSPLTLIDHGIAVASVNYRLSSEARFPAQIHDVKAAIRCLRARAAEFGIDGERLAVWGASAGAHLALLAGMTGRASVLDDLSLGHAGETCEVAAVVSWFGPTDFLKMDGYLRETGAGVPDHGDAASPESKLLGDRIDRVPSLVRAANPETWLTPDCPPVLFQHAPADPIVPVQMSVHFAARINQVAGPGRARLHLVEGAGHAGPEFDRPEVVGRTVDFLKETLRVG